MIYTLIFITAAGIQPFGAYANLTDCQTAAREFQRQEIKAGCVRQESPEEAMLRAQAVMKSFMKIMPQEK